MNISSTSLRRTAQAAPKTKLYQQSSTDSLPNPSDSFIFQSEPSSTGRTILAATAGSVVLGGAGYLLGNLTGGWGATAAAIGGAATGGAILGTATMLVTAESYQQEAVIFGGLAGGFGAIVGGVAGGMLGSGDLSIAGAIAGGLTGAASGAIASQIIP